LVKLRQANKLFGSKFKTSKKKKKKKKKNKASYNPRKNLANLPAPFPSETQFLCIGIHKPPCRNHPTSQCPDR